LYDSSYASFEWLRDNDGVYEGNWYEQFGAAGYGEDCWNPNIENYIKGTNERAIFGNCLNNNCTSKLKIRVAFKYTKPNTSHPYLYPLNSVITFCSP
jgi:hypothetical protein